MKTTNKLFSIIIATLLLLLIIPTTVYAEDGDNPGHVVIGSSYILDSEETLLGDLVIIGGSATVERGEIVRGDVFVAGGTANISGIIKGDIVAFGGIVNILEDAVVTGNVVRYGGVFNLDKEADVEGNIVSNEGADFNFTPETIPPVSSDAVEQILEGPAYMVKQLGKFLFKIVQIIGLAMIAVVLSLFLEKPLERMTTTVKDNFALSLGIGLLTVFVFPTLMVVLMITIILIPVSILGLIGFCLIGLYGWFSMALLVGDKISEIFKTQWANPLSIGVGSLALSTLSYLIGSVPCIGWVVPFLVASAGLGAAVLSRGGMRIYEADKPQDASTKMTAIPAATPMPQEVAAPDEDTSVEEALEPLDLDAIPPEDSEPEDSQE